MSLDDELTSSRDKLPVSEAWRLHGGINWASDALCDQKAYLLACLSELSYCMTSQHDLTAPKKTSRFKVIDSQLWERVGATMRIDYREAVRRFDLQPEIIVTERYVYLILRMSNVLIVAVRGTQGGQDWFVNLAAAPLLDRRVEAAHSGFAGEAHGALDQLSRAVPAGVSHIYCTGHSLGGAVASVLARDWRDSRVRRAYTFGAPRFGNVRYVEHRRPIAFGKPSDIVPHVPPRLYGYADAEIPVRSVTDQPMPKRGFGVGWQWLSGAPSAMMGGRFALEHSIERYRRLLGLRLATASDFPELAYYEALRQAYLGRHRRSDASDD